MRKEMMMPAGIGLAIALAIGAAVLWINRGAHLLLEGGIQKVRVQGMENAAAVVADFRITNPSDVPFVVRTVSMILTDSAGNDVEGVVVADTDARRVMEYYPALGQKFNDSLKTRDRIDAHQTADRMLAARFEIPQAAVDSRKSLRIRIEDVDGTVNEVRESRSAPAR